MYIDFDDLRPDTPRIEAPISVRDGVLLSVVVHALGLVAIVLLADVGREARLEAIRRAEAEAPAVVVRPEPPPDQGPFVFVQPRIDMPAPAPPDRGELSDLDRQAQSADRAFAPLNELPFARGNSAERVEPTVPGDPTEPDEAPPGESDRPGEDDSEQASESPAPGPPSAPESAEPDVILESDRLAANERSTAPFPGVEGLDGRARRERPERRPAFGGGEPAAGAALGQALQNLQEYIDRESFNNPNGGGGRFGPSIQFDTKGVEFGPWIRRFVAQIKRNWIIPYAAAWASMRGHVVITFNVHKDGRISELQVVEPSGVEGFNNSAFNALASSNPTYPLPEEYPTPTAFFTVTFYYNEGYR